MYEQLIKQEFFSNASNVKFFLYLLIILHVLSMLSIQILHITLTSKELMEKTNEQTIASKVNLFPTKTFQFHIPHCGLGFHGYGHAHITSDQLPLKIIPSHEKPLNLFRSSYFEVISLKRHNHDMTLGFLNNQLSNMIRDKRMTT